MSACCIVLLQTDGFSCTAHLLFQQQRLLMKMLCHQWLEPKRRTPQHWFSLFQEEKKKLTHSWHNWTKCVCRECVVKVPTETRGFHYERLSGPVLCCLRIPHLLPSLLCKLKTALDQTSDCSMGARNVIKLLGTLSFSSPLFQWKKRLCIHTFPHHLPVHTVS